MEQKATQQCVEAHYVKRSIMRNNLKWPAKVLFVQFTRRLMGNEVVIKKSGYIDYAMSQKGIFIIREINNLTLFKFLEKCSYFRSLRIRSVVCYYLTSKNRSFKNKIKY